MLLFDVTSEFDKCLKKLSKKWNVPYSFFKGHERRPLALKNICDQVLIQEKKNHTRQDVTRRNLLIHSAAMMFMDRTIQHRHEQLKSTVEKRRLKDAQVPKEEKAKEILASEGIGVEINDHSKSLN